VKQEEGRETSKRNKYRRMEVVYATPPFGLAAL